MMSIDVTIVNRLKNSSQFITALKLNGRAASSKSFRFVKLCHFSGAERHENRQIVTHRIILSVRNINSELVRQSEIFNPLSDS